MGGEEAFGTADGRRWTPMTPTKNLCLALANGGNDSKGTAKPESMLIGVHRRPSAVNLLLLEKTTSAWS
jgi:hypothetical protein